MEDIKVIKICVIIITLSVVVFVGYNIKVGMQLESTLDSVNSKIVTYEGYVASAKEKIKLYVGLLDLYTKETYGKSFIDELDKYEDEAKKLLQEDEAKMKEWDEYCDEKCADGIFEGEVVDMEKCYEDCHWYLNFKDGILK